MTLQKTIKEFGKTLAGLPVSVFHYTRPKKVTNRYAVWQEDGGTNSFNADNSEAEHTVSGSLDYYTKVEFDAAVDEIQRTLTEVEGCSWELTDVKYEEETEMIHFSWSWELCYG